MDIVESDIFVKIKVEKKSKQAVQQIRFASYP